MAGAHIFWFLIYNLLGIKQNLSGPKGHVEVPKIHVTNMRLSRFGGMSGY